MRAVERELVAVGVDVFGPVGEVFGVLVPDREWVRRPRQDLVEELWIRAVMSLESTLHRIDEDRDATFPDHGTADVEAERVGAREVRDEDRVDLRVRGIRVSVGQAPDADVALPLYSERLLRRKGCERRAMHLRRMTGVDRCYAARHLVRYHGFYREQPFPATGK